MIPKTTPYKRSVCAEMEIFFNPFNEYKILRIFLISIDIWINLYITIKLTATVILEALISV
jgi:hypothetical protein